MAVYFEFNVIEDGVFLQASERSGLLQVSENILNFKAADFQRLKFQKFTSFTLIEKIHLEREINVQGGKDESEAEKHNKHGVNWRRW